MYPRYFVYLILNLFENMSIHHFRRLFGHSPLPSCVRARVLDPMTNERPDAEVGYILIRIKRMFLAVLMAVFPGLVNGAGAVPFSDGRLLDKTLRMDYIFTGTDKDCDIAVAEMLSLEGWHGRRTNLKETPLRGNGQLTMTDKASRDTLYRMSFCTLFQEWQATEEATRIRKSFENVFLVPMPSAEAEITVQLFDFHGNVAASLTHPVNPDDILIRPVGGRVRTKSLLCSGDPKEKIDVAVLAEGYTEGEMDLFFKDAADAVGNLLRHEPFKSMKDRFNIVAVASPSQDSGVSVPRDGVWRKTAVDSHFDTFYSDRYLTTLHLFKMHDALAGVPYEHIIILANTDTYGGGGIYNSYTLTTARHKLFGPVVVHEFGHSFGGLADEYAYDDQYVEYYYPDVEPWEQNITTKADFGAKWKDLYDQGVVDLIEGAGYQSKGVWRSREDCRMRTNSAPDFCPVCRRAIERMIRFYTEEAR